MNLELVFGYHLKPGNGPKVSARSVGLANSHYPESPASFGHRKIICCENPLVLESGDQMSKCQVGLQV